MNYLIGYLFVINILGFLFFGIDKYKAKNNKRRVSEKNLLIISILWWILWSLLWMIYFRHKTIKNSFQIKFYLILFIWIILLLYLLINN